MLLLSLRLSLAEEAHTCAKSLPTVECERTNEMSLPTELTCGHANRLVEEREAVDLEYGEAERTFPHPHQRSAGRVNNCLRAPQNAHVCPFERSVLCPISHDRQ